MAVVSRRKWVSKYARRVGSLVNLMTWAGFGAGFMVWLQFDDSQEMPDDLSGLPFVLLISSGIAALVALLLAHLLASIQPPANRPELLIASFRATAIAVVAPPVYFIVLDEFDTTLATASALANALGIIAICRLVEWRLPPYPTRPLSTAARR